MSDMVEIERQLAQRCHELRDSAELLLEALALSPSLFTPEEANAARRLAMSTLATVEQYERNSDADTKKALRLFNRRA